MTVQVLGRVLSSLKDWINGGRDCPSSKSAWLLSVERKGDGGEEMGRRGDGRWQSGRWGQTGAISKIGGHSREILRRSICAVKIHAVECSQRARGSSRRAGEGSRCVTEGIYRTGKSYRRFGSEGRFRWRDRPDDMHALAIGQRAQPTTERRWRESNGSSMAEGSTERWENFAKTIP
jgi:hypothetical protein